MKRLHENIEGLLNRFYSIRYILYTQSNFFYDNSYTSLQKSRNTLADYKRFRWLSDLN